MSVLQNKFKRPQRGGGKCFYYKELVNLLPGLTTLPFREGQSRSDALKIPRKGWSYFFIHSLIVLPL